MDKRKKEIDEIWKEITPIQARYILTIAKIYKLEEKMKKLHPKNLVIPICLIQITTFTLIMILEPKKLIEILSISNIIIVAIAIFPTTIKRKKFHYIK